MTSETEGRAVRLMDMLATRRALVEVSKEALLRTVETSDDMEEIIEAARASLSAEGELRAIDVAARALTDLAADPRTEDERRRDRLTAANLREPGAVKQQIAETVALIIAARTHADAAEIVRETILRWPGNRTYAESLMIASVAQLGVHATIVAPAAQVSRLMTRMRVLGETLRELGLSE